MLLSEAPRAVLQAVLWPQVPWMVPSLVLEKSLLQLTCLIQVLPGLHPTCEMTPVLLPFSQCFQHWK